MYKISKLSIKKVKNNLNKNIEKWTNQMTS